MDNLALEKTADQILTLLRTQSKSVPFPKLMQQFKIGRQEVDEAIKLLASWDYRLLVRKTTGVKFVGAPDYLTATEIQHRLGTKVLGRVCYSFRTVKSTNDVAAQLAEQGAPEGTIVTAEEQTRGRGRLGRSWHSPIGTGIYMTLILRPAFSPERAPGLSVMTSLALADTITSYTRKTEVKIKWPNDVLVNGKKVAGILTELSTESRSINYVLIGVGINVNHGAGHFPEELKKSATSLRKTLKHKVRRVPLLQQFLVQLEKEYTAYKKQNLLKSRKRIRKYSSLLGQEVEIMTGGHIIGGEVVDIDASGALVLSQKGQRVIIAAGEVSVVKHR